MSAPVDLEAARVRALASLRQRRKTAAYGTTTAAAKQTADGPAAPSERCPSSPATDAPAAAPPTAASVTSGTATDASGPPPTRRRERKRRFDVLPSPPPPLPPPHLPTAPVEVANHVDVPITPAASISNHTGAVTHVDPVAFPSTAAGLIASSPSAAGLSVHPAPPHSATHAAHVTSATSAVPAATSTPADSLATSAPTAAVATKRSRWAPPTSAAGASAPQAAPAPNLSDAADAHSTALVALGRGVPIATGDEQHAGSSSALVPLDEGTSRRSRFSPALTPPPWDASARSWDASTLLALHPTHLPAGVHLLLPSICAGMSLGSADALLARMRIDAIEAQLRALAAGRPLDEADPRPMDPATGRMRARSPSPEPVYDAQGKRTNTRPQRLRARLLELQHSIVTATLARSPADFKPPKGFRSSAAGRVKFERKLLIPLDEYPDYNFKGVIIGARGLKQQELQVRTGCKIAVRGRGSWSSSRPDSMRQRHPDDDEPQHCWIQADTPEALERGVAEVSKLLVPMSDEERRRSLQELAELNGWVREPQACRVCGATDHLMKACPDRNGGRGFVAAAVSCRLCASRTHPTMDCPSTRGLTRDEVLRRMRAVGARDADQRADDEYEQFMAEILGDQTTGDGGATSGGASSRLLLTSGDGGGDTSACAGSGGPGLDGSSSDATGSSLVVRASAGPGLRLSLLPPTSREEHQAAQQRLQLHQQQGKRPTETFREYTPSHAAAANRLHAMPPDASSAPAAAALGWATHQLAAPPAHPPRFAPDAPPLLPPPSLPPPPPPLHFPYHAHAHAHSVDYPSAAPLPPYTPLPAGFHYAPPSFPLQPPPPGI